MSQFLLVHKTTQRWRICVENWTFISAGNLSFILIMSRSVSLVYNKYLQFLVRFERVRMMIDNILSSDVKVSVGVDTFHNSDLSVEKWKLWCCEGEIRRISDDLMSFHHSQFPPLVLVNFPFLDTSNFSTFQHPRLFVHPHYRLITLTMTRWKIFYDKQ